MHDTSLLIFTSLLGYFSYQWLRAHDHPPLRAWLIALIPMVICWIIHDLIWGAVRFPFFN